MAVAAAAAVAAAGEPGHLVRDEEVANGPVRHYEDARRATAPHHLDPGTEKGRGGGGVSMGGLSMETRTGKGC